MRIGLFFILFFMTPSLGTAKKLAVYFGGADGVPTENRANTFQNSFINFAENLPLKNWESDFFYSGPDKVSQQIRQKVSSSQEFSKKNYYQKMRQLISDLNSGKIKQGDSLLVILDAHGGFENGKYSFSAEDALLDTGILKAVQDLATKKMSN